ncbi:hypothetical protein F5B22DRAFT_632898 [Xylaria bambusicola]|uniref:uncharacterized protein n=1 Tax=Xylaria bambusicola TaxID=326684 RepID=UPI002008576A|nr:uncharacterized protein F5B22DRAFT_632898 [Xylaria bambusicola]KAI0526412.1 hypothetical protein F5B22DRAFT_632898 [Xylaria bambusicola]
MLREEYNQICRSIWPNLTKEEYFRNVYAGMQRYFESQTCREGRDDCAIILSIIDELMSKEHTLVSRSSYIAAVRTKLSRPSSEATVLSYSERTLRMMLNLDIRVGQGRESISRVGSFTIDWDDLTSLGEAIENHFAVDSRRAVTGRIDPALSLGYLCTHRGFKVFWTSNISEHLHISWKSKIVMVYEHKLFLWNHLRNSESPIIPRLVLEEAIDTLNLLFPLNDRLTTKFLAQNGKEFQGLGYCSRSRDICLDIGNFKVWRERIAELVEVMNEEPKGLKQLVLEKDGRNLLPFVTFWVAVVVAFLSLLNLPFAMVSMNYSIKQYDLALAQACSEPNAQNTLPKYCSA